MWRLLVSGLVGVVSATACGQSHTSTAPPADSRLLVAAALATRVDEEGRSARYSMASFIPLGKPRSIPDATAEGTADLEHKRYHATLRAPAPRALQDEVYVVGLLEYERGTQYTESPTTWHRHSYSPNEVALAVPVNPLVEVSSLGESRSSRVQRRDEMDARIDRVDKLGVEQIHGTATARYHAAVRGTRSQEVTGVDVWLDDEGRVRKLAIPSLIQYELWDVDMAPMIDLPSDLNSMPTP